MERTYGMYLTLTFLAEAKLWTTIALFSDPLIATVKFDATNKFEIPDM